jgi:hypothetical protein
MIALKPGGRLCIGIGRALYLQDADRLECAEEIGVLLARHHADEATEAKPGRERVGAREHRAEQRQEAVEEAVVLDEITRHNCIGHGSGEQRLDKAMPHGMRPARLARSAQSFGESWHDVGSRRRHDRQDSGSMQPRGLRWCGKTGRELESQRWSSRGF